MHMFVSKTKFRQVLRIYTHLSKNYKHFVRGKLTNFWKKDVYYLRKVFVLQIQLRYKSKQFSVKQVCAFAPEKSSCFTSLILVNLVKLVPILVPSDNVSIVKLFLSQRFKYCSVVYYFLSSTICPLPFSFKGT